ncbi:polysaccharide biosynthesis protein [Corchorus olitorius]|uniref:Polysaccharide biosynthesis protein n=1 Tax=Corchorus olitorius TaxID=93759 RepID=A0A1R3IQA7_9ROSI|nr:polysaccharide biosynthesis protein [Corchorus olitorius]
MNVWVKYEEVTLYVEHDVHDPDVKNQGAENAHDVENPEAVDYSEIVGHAEVVDLTENAGGVNASGVSGVGENDFNVAEFGGSEINNEDLKVEDLGGLGLGEDINDNGLAADLGEGLESKDEDYIESHGVKKAHLVRTKYCRDGEGDEELEDARNKAHKEAGRALRQRFAAE